MSVIGTFAGGAASSAINAFREADAIKSEMEGAAIEHQERENAISGMKVNLANNQMRRMNDSQKTLGGIG